MSPKDLERCLNRFLAQREKLDPAQIYAQLKDAYPLVLFHAPVYDYEIPVLSGESSAGRFELYDDGASIIFEIATPDGPGPHWHPADPNEATRMVAAFMNGIYPPHTR